MVKVVFKLEGLKELDEALKELPEAVARNVLKRVLTKAAQPIADAAARNVPRDTGFLSENIIVKAGSKND